VITNNAPARFAVGGNVVTWFGKDGIDAMVAAQQKVTVRDMTAPTVSCTAVDPRIYRFQAAGSDDCTDRISLALGSYAISNGEVIQFQYSAEPGVRYVGTFDGVRRFLVGRGQGVIKATDAAGNIASAICQ